MKNKFEPWLDVLGNTLDKNDFMLNYDEYCKYLYVYMDFTNFINNVQKEFFLYKYDLKVDNEHLELIWDEYPEDYISFIKFIKENREVRLNDYLIDSIDFFYDDDRDFIFMEKKYHLCLVIGICILFLGLIKNRMLSSLLIGMIPL